MTQESLLGRLIGLTNQPKKPRVFVSYHHETDQVWYDRFSTLLGGAYAVFTDPSLDRSMDSTNAEYLTRSIREKRITGSSVTIVLCGNETWKRRWIDWEIDMTLRKNHALLGINLPTNRPNPNGVYIVPDRLHDNINSGYAQWIPWTEDPGVVRSAIFTARDRTRSTTRIVNNRARLERSRP